jgi:hypothetical protein
MSNRGRTKLWFGCLGCVAFSSFLPLGGVVGCSSSESAAEESHSQVGYGGTVARGSSSHGSAIGGEASLGGAAAIGGNSGSTVPVQQGGGSYASGSESRANGGDGGRGEQGQGGGSMALRGSASGGATNGTSSISTESPQSTDVIASFRNGVYWNDTSGKRIEAHGGGFLFERGTWYWFGEDKSHNAGTFRAVNCYASTNLVDWRFLRAVVTRSTATQLGVAERIIERPKVIYNEATRQYVMWLHWDGKNYADAAAGVFTSSKVDGEYRFERSFRPNSNMSRDDTLFRDDDGRAYFISAANENKDLIIYELSDDYLTIKQQLVTLWPSNWREAPALFKHAGLYYLVTSGATGWDPNQAKYATATNLKGPWSALANLGDGTTYDTQSNYVIPIQGSKTTTFVFSADRWQDPDLVSSKYVFLPLKVHGATLRLDYYDEWQLNLTTGNWSAKDGFLPRSEWRVIHVDSQETVAEDGRASNAFDDSGLTFWHTEYEAKKPPFPHEIQIDLGATYELEGFRHLPRQDKDQNGMVARYEFYVSMEPSDFGEKVASGTFSATRDATMVRFERKVGRFVRFVALSGVASDSNLASVGELDLVGVRR